jgi:hypothetical protein
MSSPHPAQAMICDELSTDASGLNQVWAEVFYRFRFFRLTGFVQGPGLLSFAIGCHGFASIPLSTVRRQRNDRVPGEGDISGEISNRFSPGSC